MRREDFLRRVRGALQRAEGDPMEYPPALRPRLSAWDEEQLALTFERELAAVGGRVRRVPGRAEAIVAVAELAAASSSAALLAAPDPLVAEVLTGVQVPVADDPAAADLGVTSALCGIATTGTLVLSSAAGRLAGLLPMHHLCLLETRRLVPTMAEALALYGEELPASWVQVTGPSRTADIELTLTTGVHGPGVVDVVLIGPVGD